MKKLLLVISFIIFCHMAKAQQGFGTNSPAPSAVIDMVSGTKGALLPRVALTSIIVAAPVILPAYALTVFNTATTSIGVNDVKPGYYYWNGAKWVPLETEQDLRFVGAGRNHITVDAGIGGNGTTMNGAQNIAMGENALSQNSGHYNVAIGAYSVLRLNTIGTGNIAIGAQALELNTTGHTNIGIGLSALAVKAQGNGNVALGNSAFQQFKSGNSNIAIGADAGYNLDNGDNNIFIGANTQPSVSANASNQLNIGDWIYGDNGKIGVGNNVAAPKERLEIGYDGTQALSATNLGGLRIKGINDAYYAGSSTDKIVVVDNTGLLKTINSSTFASTEPWQVQGTTAQATANAQNIYQNGKVAIGIANGTAIPAAEVTATNPKLYVEGNVTITGKYYTTNSVYADYVFEKYLNGFSTIDPNYRFRSLAEVDTFIKTNKHLPGVTPITGTQKTKNGYSFDMTALSIQSLEKIEELYLHVIEIDMKVSEKDKEITVLQEKTKSLEDRLSKLEQLINKK